MSERGSGLNRRTLDFIDYYPEPSELLERIASNHWNYKSNRKELLKARDTALASLLYCGAIRISEAQRLTKGQVKDKPLRLIAVKLSKSERRDKNGKLIVRKTLFRKEIKLPTKGKRAQFTPLIENYLSLLSNKGEDFKLFNIGNARMHQIITTKLAIPCHWLRAFGENFLYELWDNDLIAVAKHVEVDPRTLAKYIHRTPAKYLKRE